MATNEQFGPRAPRLRSRFFSNHGLVLACVAEDRDARVRTVAARVGITERTAQSILAELVHEGYLRRIKLGRRNRYEIVRYAPLGEGFSREPTVADLVDVLAPKPPAMGDFTNP
jgi:DNA-binding MarR family transcriptional regulator